MKVGDKYIYITNTWDEYMKKGQVYEVIRVDGEHIYLNDGNPNSRWFASHLEGHLVPDSPLARAVYCSTEESANV